MEQFSSLPSSNASRQATSKRAVHPSFRVVNARAPTVINTFTVHASATFGDKFLLHIAEIDGET